MKKHVVVFVLLLLTYAGQLFSQIKIDSTEITSNVPELTDFHSIIYPMWHNAYPTKDINALKAFVPQIKIFMDKINQATLPGILKDKEIKWKNQLIELNTAAENYYKAANDKNDEALLAATEKLHHNYEMMVRVIKPVIKEMDEYHQTLYIIYHKLYPDKKYTEIAGLMDDLILKADAIAQYPLDKLKRRLGDNTVKFDLASKELYKATLSLKEVLKGTDAKEKDKAVENMHTMYQHLESVFM
jgi:hypothetical protein